MNPSPLRFDPWYEHTKTYFPAYIPYGKRLFKLFSKATPENIELKLFWYFLSYPPTDTGEDAVIQHFANSGDFLFDHWMEFFDMSEFIKMKRDAATVLNILQGLALDGSFGDFYSWRHVWHALYATVQCGDLNKYWEYLRKTRLYSKWEKQHLCLQMCGEPERLRYAGRYTVDERTLRSLGDSSKG